MLDEPECGLSGRIFEPSEERERKFELGFHFEGLAPVLR